MKTYKQFLNEAELTSEIFITTMEKDFRKHFPMGFFRVSVESSIGGGKHITGFFGLVKSKNDLPGNYHENDPMAHRFMVFPEDDAEDLTGKVTFSISQGSLSINPEVGSYMAMGRVKTKLTAVKKNGSLLKFQKKMKTFFGKLAKIVKDNADEIYGADKIEKYIKSVK